MKNIVFTLVAAALLSMEAAGQSVNVTQGSTVNAAITDNDLNGLSDTINLSGTGIQSVSSVTVFLDISSGWNGDYYAYLEHDGEISVLLNRVGLDANTPYGYSDMGFQVTFADNAANGDIHTYQTVSDPNGGVLTGTWQPDARTEDPLTVTTSSPRTDFLSDFDGGSADGAWTLFIADCSEGEIGVFNNWSIDVTGTAAVTTVPDGLNTFILLAGAAAALLVARVKKSRAF